MSRSQWIAIIVSALLAALSAGVARTTASIPRVAHKTTVKHVVLPADDRAWLAGPADMPAGSRWAIVSGEPMQAAPFVVRVELPPGSEMPPYRRSRDENIIVLAGTLEVGSGLRAEPGALRVLPTGSFVTLPANEAHFLRTQPGATIQIFGLGPFEAEYLEKR